MHRRTITTITAVVAAVAALAGCSNDGEPITDTEAVETIRDRYGPAFATVTDDQLRSLADTVCGWYTDDGPEFVHTTGVRIASRTHALTGDEARDLFVVFTRWRCPELTETATTIDE